MRRALGWLALLRPMNLAMVALTPLALWLSLVQPLLVEPRLRVDQVFMLGCAIALVAGAGNVVNDIADRTIDELNERPNPLLAGVSAAEAWGIYAALNLGAVLCTWWIARDLGWWGATLLLPLAIGLLLLYSLVLKCRPLVGNLVVALLCAGVPGLVIYGEPSLLGALPRASGAHAILAYTAFAFVGTMARELVKDLQDRSGDRAAGCRTAAVAWPRRRLHALVLALGFVSLVCVGYIAAVYWRAEAPMAALAWLAVWGVLALSLNGVKSTRQLDPTDYAAVSRHLKWALALALLILIFYGRPSWTPPAT